MYSSDTTKYLIHLFLEAEGVVEKPDVVGAIFGQTEGLLGEDLDLRDPQRTRRVGRIDVQVSSKKGETLRRFPMKDADAVFLYRWTLYIVAGAAVITGASAVLGEIEADKPLYLMSYSLGGAYIAIALIVMIWKSRQRVAEAILPANVAAGKGGPRAAFARYWHFLASAYDLCMGVYWVADVLLGGKVMVVKLILSLFVIPIFMGLDHWGLRLLKLASREMTQVADLSGDQVREVPPLGEQNKIKHYAPLIRKLFRLILVAFMFFLVLGLWGVDLTVGTGSRRWKIVPCEMRSCRLQRRRSLRGQDRAQAVWHAEGSG